MLVDICIATYKRPVLLRELLESLEEQQVAPGVEFRIIVVDNDKKCSARDVVNEFKNKVSTSVIYDVEPVQNIALARNRALSHIEGVHIAFIDDDETADIHWLQNMIDAIKKYKADMVFAPVKPIYTKNTPNWILNGRFFERKRYQSGIVVKHGKTNNALLRSEIVKKNDYRFNPIFGLSGGEDTEFFHKLSLAGYKMIWCDSGVVYEKVGIERMSIGWLVKRAFRGGQTYARIFVRSWSFDRKLMWCLQKVFYLSMWCMCLPFAWLYGRHLGVFVLQKITGQIGQLLGETKYQYHEYANDN